MYSITGAVRVAEAKMMNVSTLVCAITRYSSMPTSSIKIVCIQAFLTVCANFVTFFFVKQFFVTLEIVLRNYFFAL